MKIEVSNGEAIDRWTILLIKANAFANDPDRSDAVIKELKQLSDDIAPLLKSVPPETIDHLMNVNLTLWKLENKIRQPVSNVDEFVTISHDIHIFNDTRSSIKRKINELTNSPLREVKGHPNA